MPDTTMKHCERDLLALMTPFKSSEDQDMERQTEARALLAFVGDILESSQGELISNPLWHEYLNITRRPDFLNNLGSHEVRLQWADCMFRIVDLSRYSLRDMLEQRVSEHPQRLLFREVDNGHSQWSYQQVFSYMKKIAAVFYSAVKQPRVLLYLENSPEGACADLACLTFGILDSPIDRFFFDGGAASSILRTINVMDDINYNKL